MVTLSDIQTALGRIRESIQISPCTRSATFSELTGNSIYLKLENRQRTGAYKERGALNKLLSLTAEERSLGVIAASAGNHAQAVAYHASNLGIRARIVMPLPTPLIKGSATRATYCSSVRTSMRLTRRRSDSARRIISLLSMPSTMTPILLGRELWDWN